MSTQNKTDNIQNDEGINLPPATTSSLIAILLTDVFLATYCGLHISSNGITDMWMCFQLCFQTFFPAISVLMTVIILQNISQLRKNTHPRWSFTDLLLFSTPTYFLACSTYQRASQKGFVVFFVFSSVFLEVLALISVVQTQDDSDFPR